MPTTPEISMSGSMPTFVNNSTNAEIMVIMIPGIEPNESCKKPSDADAIIATITGRSFGS